jgi:hypothetical protein
MIAGEIMQSVCAAAVGGGAAATPPSGARANAAAPTAVAMHLPACMP